MNARPMLVREASYHHALKQWRCACDDPDSEVYGKQSPDCTRLVERGDEYVQWGSSFGERFCLPCGVTYFAASEEEVAAWRAMIRRVVEAAPSGSEPKPTRLSDGSAQNADQPRKPSHGAEAKPRSTFSHAPTVVMAAIRIRALHDWRASRAALERLSGHAKACVPALGRRVAQAENDES